VKENFIGQPVSRFQKIRRFIDATAIPKINHYTLGQEATIKSFAKNANRQSETAKFNYKQPCRECMFESSMQIKTTQKLRS
jgi:hypothetical protein